jgi:hypothetical protein
MLDVLAVAYLYPLPEQVLDDITPLIAVRNQGDEPAVVTGLVRIYRSSTDTKLFASKLAVTTIQPGELANIATLSTWSPPAPASSDYFILTQIDVVSLYDGHKTSSGLGAWYFDVKVGPMGPAPAAHAGTHAATGMDPILVDSLATAETDTSLVLKADGTGAVLWGNVPHEHPSANGTTSSATPTPNADTTDLYFLTALDQAADFAAPTGTPYNGQKLIVRIKSDSTPRALSWNSGSGGYSSRGATLPTTTTASKITYVGLIYNSATDTWDCVAVSQET